MIDNDVQFEKNDIVFNYRVAIRYLFKKILELVILHYLVEDVN